ncbi:MAG: tetratricopeptide repeat protein [Myxococcota bacterium]
MDGEIEHGAFVSAFAYEWFVEGEVAAAKGRHDESAIALETANASPSDDALLMARLAEEYEMSGASRRADRTLSVARRSDPQSARVWLAKGRIHMLRAEYDEAMRALVTASKRDPTSDEIAIALGRALRTQGLRLRANAVLIAYIERNYDTETEGARRVLLELARTDSDPQTLQRALALGASEDRDREAFLAAELAYKAGQPALAARLLDGALETPESRALWLRAAIRSGDRASARDFLVSTPSDALGGPAKHAAWLLELGEPTLALEVLQSETPSPRVVTLRGRALADRGDYVAATRALSGVPHGSSTYDGARLAFAESAKARIREGAAAEALSSAPSDSREVRFELAKLYLSQGDLKRGLRLFDPKRPSDRPAIARLFEEAGHSREASAYYATIDEQAPESAAVLARAAAERLMARGRYEPAAEVLRQWTASSPDDLYARARLIEILTLLDRSSEATAEAHALLPYIHHPALLKRVTPPTQNATDSKHLETAPRKPESQPTQTAPVSQD